MWRNMSIETDKEITKGETINGFPGWVHWNKESNDGNIGIIVNDRIFVIIEGRNTGLDEVRAVANSLDLSGVAKLAS